MRSAWQWNGAAVNDPASLSIHQSLADRCKKIHAGDEVIQVNHQTVVRPHFLLSGLFCVFFTFTVWICIWFFADRLCKCLFNSRMLFLYTKKYLPQIVHMLWLWFLYTHSYLCCSAAALLDLLLYKWPAVVPLVGSFWGCGYVTVAGWICYFARHWVSRMVSQNHRTHAHKSTSVDREGAA